MVVGVLCIAIGASEVTARCAYKQCWVSCIRTFALNRIEGLIDFKLLMKLRIDATALDGGVWRWVGRYNVFHEGAMSNKEIARCEMKYLTRCILCLI